jgi:futalosine hydrolase
MKGNLKMPFKILYVTASDLEADSLKRISGLMPVKVGYQFGELEIDLLISGVGSVSTSWSMMRWICQNGRPDLAINGGIAGSYKDEILTGDVVMPESDCFADSGIEDGDNFYTLSEGGLIGSDDFPYKNGLLLADKTYFGKLNNIIRPVKAITVNAATGSEKTKSILEKKFNPDIETMEGATFFYICSQENIPFIALRAISNKVERRNRNNWKIPLALGNLSEKLIEVLLTVK